MVQSIFHTSCCLSDTHLTDLLNTQASRILRDPSENLRVNGIPGFPLIHTSGHHITEVLHVDQAQFASGKPVLVVPSHRFTDTLRSEGTSGGL